MNDPNFDCTAKLKPYPKEPWGATGGLIRQKPLICGGLINTRVYKESGAGIKMPNRAKPSFSQACYALQEDGSWKEEEATLSKGRMWYGSGSVVLNDELVIARGLGRFGDDMSKSIEVVGGRITKARTLEDIELPQETYRSCIVPWDADTFMVIGGNPYKYGGGGMDAYSQTGTYFVDIKKKTVTNGPDLNNARYRHGCSEMIVDGEEFIVVTGGHGPKESVHKSTEYLSKASFKTDGWQEGTDLPVHISDHQMVTSPDKQFVYTIGNGFRPYDKESSQEIYKYTCQNNDIKQCIWTKSKTKLKYGRRYLVAFGIPNSWAKNICE